jgi:hypothetical protein
MLLTFGVIMVFIIKSFQDKETKNFPPYPSGRNPYERIFTDHGNQPIPIVKGYKCAAQAHK